MGLKQLLCCASEEHEDFVEPAPDPSANRSSVLFARRLHLPHIHQRTAESSSPSPEAVDTASANSVEMLPFSDYRIRMEDLQRQTTSQSTTATSMRDDAFTLNHSASNAQSTHNGQRGSLYFDDHLNPNFG